MRKLTHIAITAIAVVSVGAVVALAGDVWDVRTIEKSSIAKTAFVLDEAFETPKVLDSVYVFVPSQLTTGTFTNYLTMIHSRSTNGFGTNVVSGTTVITQATSSQSVHAVYINDLNLKVVEGDVLYLSNTMARTTTRLFFK